MKRVINFLVRIKRSLRRRITRFIVSKQVSKIGRNFICDEDVTVYGGENITIGDDVVINKGVIIQSCEGAKIIIGNNVTFSYGAKLITGNLEMHASLKNKRIHSSKIIEIGDSVWIGANAIVLPGIKITNGVIVAAGCVVSKSINDSGYIYGGIPAKKIGTV